jgi:hypothetical protein
MPMGILRSSANTCTLPALPVAGSISERMKSLSVAFPAGAAKG